VLGLALMSLSACSGDSPGTQGEPCADFEPSSAEGSPVVCDGDAFESLGDIAWRQAPQSESCPATSCAALEIVATFACPRIILDFGDRMWWKGDQLIGSSATVFKAKPGVRYTYHFVANQYSAPLEPPSVLCWYPT
jgi:hypothetical protein